MRLESFRRWIHRIYTTRDEELDCEGFSRLIPQYVDLQVLGKPADQHFPEVKHHLDQCRECNDLYMTLRDAAQTEVKQTAPESVEIERL